MYECSSIWILSLERFYLKPQLRQKLQEYHRKLILVRLSLEKSQTCDVYWMLKRIYWHKTNEVRIFSIKFYKTLHFCFISCISIICSSLDLTKMIWLFFIFLQCFDFAVMILDWAIKISTNSREAKIKTVSLESQKTNLFEFITLF